MSDIEFLYDRTESTTTRFVCFIGEALYRFDLAITTTTNFYGKTLVTDLQTGKSAIIGPDDLAEEGYLAYVYKINEEQASELQSFLVEVIGDTYFTDI
jgi:hypothetical protein